MPRCPKTSGTGTGAAGKPKKKMSLMDKLFAGETTTRKKGMKFGIKAALSTIASVTFLKKILGKLEESSGYLGAVFKILGKTFLLALMPIATLLGAVLMPVALQWLELTRGLLDAIKPGLAAVIGGDMSVSEFLTEYGDEITNYTTTVGKGVIDIVFGLAKMIFEGVLNLIGISFDSLIIGLVAIFGGILAAIALVGLGFPAGLTIIFGIAIGLIATVLATFGIKLLQWVYNLGVAFGTFISNIVASLRLIGWEILNAFTAFISNLGNTLRKIPGMILSAARNAISRIGGGGGSSRAKDSSGNLVSKLIGRLPRFAEGGVANKATAGIFGEKGPEALVPLKKSGGMGGSYTFNISIDRPEIKSEMDMDEIARRVSDQIYDNVRRSTSW